MSASTRRREAWSSTGVPGLFATVLLGALLATGLAGPEPVRGQSILGAGGLGFPVEPIGARARGLGSLGVGLFGTALLPGDPAVSRDLQVPMITGTYQPTWSTYAFQGPEQNVSTSRFPLLGVAYPVAALGGMATLSFGSFLDANWRIQHPRTVELGGESMDVTDHFRSSGGISALRLGWAQDLHETLDVAVSAGSYLGDIRRIFTRSFEGASADAPIEPYQISGKWRFTGPTVTVGSTWDPSELVRVGGSVNWSGQLHAEAVEGTEAPDRDIELPTEFRLGASGSLSPRLFVNLGVSYADWTATSGDLTGSSTVGAAWSYGGGLEWEGPVVLNRSLPFRIGYRQSDLPFRFEGADPTESAFALGLGLNLLQVEDLPLAVIDLALEIGSREAGTFSEDFSRATMTIRVAGN